MTSAEQDKVDCRQLEYWNVLMRWARRVLGADQRLWRWMLYNTAAGARLELALRRFGWYESFVSRVRSYERSFRGSIPGPPHRIMCRTNAQT